jgi:hypothetical protein
VASAQTLSATLLIFSGRPDPSFELNDEETSDLAGRVQSTIGGQQVPEAHEGGLGYRGFLVRNTAGIEGVPAQIVVFGGVVTEQEGTEARNWRDTGGCEDALVAAARSRELGDLIAAGGGPGSAVA